MAGFTEVAQVDDKVVDHPAKREASAAMQMLLAALSQKIGAFAYALFTLLTVGSCWWLFMKVLDQPTVLQLVGLAMYGTFILTLHVIRGRQK